MNCPAKNEGEWATLLSYALDKLPASASSTLKEHLGECPECASVVKQQQSVQSSLDLWEAVQVSTDFDRKLYARISEEETRTWRRFLPELKISGLRSSLVPAVACFAALFTAVLLHNPAQTPVKPAKDAAKHLELSEVEQVERTLEDMEMLRQLSVSPGGKSL